MNMPSPQEIHDAKQYYQFFDSIPVNQWCQGWFVRGSNRHCAMSHLNKENINLNSLNNMFRKFFSKSIIHVNDEGFHDSSFCYGDYGGHKAKNNILVAFKKIIDGLVVCHQSEKYLEE